MWLRHALERPPRASSVKITTPCCRGTANLGSTASAPSTFNQVGRMERLPTAHRKCHGKSVIPFGTRCGLRVGYDWTRCIARKKTRRLYVGYPIPVGSMTGLFRNFPVPNVTSLRYPEAMQGSCSTASRDHPPRSSRNPLTTRVYLLLK